MWNFNIDVVDRKTLNITTLQHDISTVHCTHTYGNIYSFLQNFLLIKNAKIWDIFVSVTCLSLQENHYNMNIDIHVVDGYRLNTNALQQTVRSLFVNWREGFFKKKKNRNGQWIANFSLLEIKK